MNIIIPLGGKGERFKSKGFKEPKPFIDVCGKEIISYVLDSLKLNDDDAVFIVHCASLENHLTFTKLKKKNPHVNFVRLSKATKGAAETILLGLSIISESHPSNRPCLLLDGDTFYTNDIVSAFRPLVTNALTYFIDKELKPLYSYIDLNNESKVKAIAEKVKISDFANTGAYYFIKMTELKHYCDFIVCNNLTFNNEFYTSRVISKMLEDEHYFVGIKVDDNSILSLGTPEQVESFMEHRLCFLFDLDGTIVRTDDIYLEVWTGLLQSFNVVLNMEIYVSHIQGKSDNDVIQSLLPKADIDVALLSAQKDNLFKKQLHRLTQVQNAKSFMENIRKMGHKLAIVTNCNRITAENILNYCEFPYDVLVVGNECERPKPYPDPYLMAMKYFRMSSGKSVIFEDSKSGILSASATSAMCIVGVVGTQTREELASTCHIVIDNFSDVGFEDIIKFLGRDTYTDVKEMIRSSLSRSYEIADIHIDLTKLKGGFIADVLKVLLHLTSGKTIECVLKLESNNASNLSKMASQLDLYNREYYFYECISKYADIKIPNYIGLIKDKDFKTRGVLLQDLSSKHFLQNIDLNTLPVNVTLRIIEMLSKLHAKFWNKDITSAFQYLKKNNDPQFYPCWPDYVNSRWRMFEQKWSRSLSASQLQLGFSISQNFHSIQDRLSQGHLTLCHGDVKSANIFFEQVANDNLLEPHFIDWQYIICGKGVQDLAFFIIESLNNHNIVLWEGLLKEYYYVKLHECKVLNYSRTDFHADYIAAICYFPFFVCMWFGTAPDDDLIDKNFPFFYVQRFFFFLQLHDVEISAYLATL